MKKSTFSLIPFLKLLAVLVFLAPLSSFAICMDAEFPTSFSYHNFTEDNLPGAINVHYGEDWCAVDKLCPIGVVKSNAECNVVSADLRTKWQTVLGAANMAEFFDDKTVQGVTTKGLYYIKKMCGICTNANSNSDGSGAHTTTPTDPTTPPGTPPPAGVPTTVTIGGFDKLENPLGPAKLTTVSDVIQRALGIIIKVSIPFVVLMLIWTGFQFVIAQGNSSKITAAKNTLLWVIVGAAILIGCVAIANAIANSVESVAKVASGE